MTSPKRCDWVSDDPLYLTYHDTEWGVPLYDDQRLFEFLILEGMQAGLSWITILKKRENYRKLLSNFDAEKIARFKQADINRLLQNPGIIRNKLKVNSIVTNARAYLDVMEHGSFAEYIWRFVDGEPIVNKFRALKDVPSSTTISDLMSKDLKKKGFKFVGSTICYAYMQATGMVNDHVTNCFRYKECKE
jgi:DNA-3-methyladenine glycosylase I